MRVWPITIAHFRWWYSKWNWPMSSFALQISVLCGQTTLSWKYYKVTPTVAQIEQVPDLAAISFSRHTSPTAHRGIGKTRNSRWLLSVRLPNCGEPRRRCRRCAFPSVTLTVSRQEQSWLRPATSAPWSHPLTQCWSAQLCSQTNS